MTQLLDLIEDFMDLKELRYARLDGATKFDDRVSEVWPETYNNIINSLNMSIHKHMSVYDCFGVSFCL